MLSSHPILNRACCLGRMSALTEFHASRCAGVWLNATLRRFAVHSKC